MSEDRKTSRTAANYRPLSIKQLNNRLIVLDLLLPAYYLYCIHIYCIIIYHYTAIYYIWYTAELLYIIVLCGYIMRYSDIMVLCYDILCLYALMRLYGIIRLYRAIILCDTVGLWYYIIICEICDTMLCGIEYYARQSVDCVISY